MRASLVGRLRSPNDPRLRLQAHACEARPCASHSLDGLRDHVADDEEIVNGLLIDEQGTSAFPIADSVASLLRDEDVDLASHMSLLEERKKHAPRQFREAVAATLQRLSRRTADWTGQWNREEMAYWDRDVTTSEGRARIAQAYRTTTSWGVFGTQATYLARPMQRELDGRLQLEVGCGAARTMSQLAARGELRGTYVGIDVSRLRLTLAKSLMPSGTFIQASALALPFEDAAFAGVLGFGVYHHLSDPLAAIADSVKKLTPGGLIGFHEPIDTPKLLPPESRLRPLARALLETYPHSEHDGAIPLRQTLQLLRNAGLTVLTEHYSMSIARTLSDRLISCIQADEVARRAYQAADVMDALTIASICRLSQRFGPRAVTLLARNGDGIDHGL